MVIQRSDRITCETSSPSPHRFDNSLVWLFVSAEELQKISWVLVADDISRSTTDEPQKSHAGLVDRTVY
ncbi:hypothetical protein VB735_34385, partial [Halotia wernerae UHCC 0503]|nr:hypothetical protein [Halotia wernerae UHCC 0503]